MNIHTFSQEIITRKVQLWTILVQGARIFTIGFLPGEKLVDIGCGNIFVFKAIPKTCYIS